MNDDTRIEDILRNLAATTAGMRADLTRLMETVESNQRQSVEDRQRLHNDMGGLRERLAGVEVRLSSLETQWMNSAPERKKLSAWLTIGGGIGAVALGIVTAWLTGMLKGD